MRGRERERGCLGAEGQCASKPAVVRKCETINRYTVGQYTGWRDFTAPRVCTRAWCSVMYLDI